MVNRYLLNLLFTYGFLNFAALLGFIWSGGHISVYEKAVPLGIFFQVLAFCFFMNLKREPKGSPLTEWSTEHFQEIRNGIMKIGLIGGLLFFAFGIVKTIDHFDESHETFARLIAVAFCLLANGLLLWLAASLAPAPKALPYKEIILNALKKIPGYFKLVGIFVGLFFLIFMLSI